MSNRLAQPDAAADTAILEWIDEVADRFETAWKCGAAPRLADFVRDDTGGPRSALIHELVKIDVEYRWRRGERRKVEDYVAEFPDLVGSDGSLPDDLVLHAAEVGEAYGAAARAADAASVSPVGAARSEGLPRTLGKFQLVELLGRGAFGAVYKARDPELGRVVAVKLPRAGCFGSADAEERFLREARSAAQLKHPAIVPVHAIAHEGDMPYIVSGYVEGQTLAQLLADRRPDFRESAELTAQVAEAIDYAHRQGVIHRDLSPRNILVDAAGRPHVTDFGLAHRDEAGAVTLDGQVLGTPAYMSPEQAAGESARVDGRSDVYSLGVILYELLTAELPFRGQVRMLLHQVLHEEPRPPRNYNDAIPRDLETICLKAMAKSPAHRYATAVGLAADLRRYLNGEPIHARPVSAAERLWRWARRNPAIAGLAAGVAALLVTLVVGLAYEVIRIAEARDEAERNYRREQETLSFVQASRAVLLLEGTNSLGLLDLLEARKKVEPLPQLHQSRSLLWSGWYAACPRLMHVLGHDAGVHGLAFSRDGSLALTAGKDGTAQLWDPATGLPRGEPLARLADDARTVALSPDGRLLAVVTKDLKAQLWETATGRPSDKPFQAFDCARVAFSPDGRYFAAIRFAREVRLWNVATGGLHGAPLRHDDDLWSMAFSPDGKFLATGSANTGPVWLWDTATGQPRFKMRHHSDRVTALAFSPDGKRLATASWDDTVRLWDTAGGRLSEPLAHGENVLAVAFSPDGQVLATGAYDGTARLWDAATGQRRTLLRHEGPVWSVAFSPDGKLLATGSSDHTARLWDTATGATHGWPLRHQDVVNLVAFHPNGKLLATASQDQTARLWDLAATEPTVLPHQKRVWVVAFSSDDKLLATVSEDGLAYLWDTASGRRHGGPMKHGKEALAVAFHPHGRLLATGDAMSKTVRFWDSATANPHGQPLQLDQEIRSLAFSPDGALLAAGGLHSATNGMTQVWDWAAARLHTGPLPQPGMVSSVSFSPDGRLLATGSMGGLVQLWDAATGLARGQPVQHGPVEAVAFRPDGTLLATAGRDLAVRFWDPATASPHGQPLRLRAIIHALAFSPDGHQLATAADDGTAQLWDLATGLPCGKALKHQGIGVASIAFSHDGRHLATGSFDKSARIWPVPEVISDLHTIEIRTWAALGARPNGQGTVEAIPWREWQALHQQAQNTRP